MRNLILLRHGQSLWNLENRFTGWTDVDLSEKGVAEARNAGSLIRQSGIMPDIAFTSVLKRAIRTLHLAEEEAGRLWIPEVKSWRLNERHYGALQGLDKAETARKYGDGQVKIWRRSYDVPPPMLEENDPRNPRLEEMYSRLDRRVVPLGESLKTTIGRTVPFWQDAIAPALLDGRTPIVAAHGNSLRGLLKYLEGIGDAEIANLEIPTGLPIVCELDDDLRFVRRYEL